MSYVVTYFFHFFAMAIFCNMLSLYLAEGLGKTDSELSFIVSASSLFGLISNPIVGYLNDRFRKPKILCAILLANAAVFSLLFAVTKSTVALYFLNGGILGLTAGVGQINERVASSSKYRYGKIRIWGTIGYAVACQYAGLVMELAPSYVLFISAAVSLCIAAVSYLLLGETSFEALPKESGDKKAAHRLKFLKSPMFLLFAVIAMLYSGITALNNTYCPILLQEIGLSTGTVGTVISLAVIIELPLVLFSNYYMDRFSGKVLASACLALMILEFLLFGICDSPVVMLIVVILFKENCAMLFVMIQLKLIRDIVDEEAVSTAQGTMASATALATIALQNAGGYISTILGTQSMFLCIAGLTAVAFTLCLFIKVKSAKKIFS